MEELIHLTTTTNLPLSLNQKRLWIMSQLDKHNPAYNIQMTYLLEGVIDIEIFRKSVSQLFERQHTLFSVFREENGVPCIDIIKSSVNVELIDFSDISVQSRREEILSFAGEDSRKSFDIEKGPLYRLFLLKESEECYVFYASFHHIIFDGWSIKVFIQDLSRIYNNLIKGVDEKLEPLQYYSYDFAASEDLKGSPVDEDAMLEFWKENLKDTPVELKFPYDYPRKKKSSGFAFRESLKIPKEKTDKLKELSKNGNSTLFQTMLTVLGVLIHKYTGEADFCIGVPVSNRRSFPAFRISGLFVNTAVVRMKIDNRNNLIQNIINQHEFTKKAISNSRLPFEKIVETVNPQRINGINPFFQISLSWVNNLSMTLDLGDVSGKWTAPKKGVTPFDITFYIWENGNMLEGEIECSADIMRYESLIRLRNHFLTLVDNIVEDADSPVELLSIISDQEKKLITSINNTQTPYSKEKTIVRLFEERASVVPENEAIVFDDCRITYSELNEKANRLAEVLKSSDVKPGDLIGLLLRRSPDLIVCLLAIFKCGAAYVPLNLSDPDYRILSIIKTADIKFVITNIDQDLKIPGSCERLSIEQLVDQSAGVRVTGKNFEGRSTDNAYIIFTSGTTGTPKGVLVNHRSVINIIEWVNRTFNVSSKDKLLWITNLSFDLSVYDIFGILAAGGCIRIVNEDDRLDPEKQYDIILNEGITFWDSAPQSLQQITPFLNKSRDAGLYNSLRLVFLSGDWIPLSLQPTITSVFNSAVVVGLGGATEATIWSNYFIIDKINPEWKSIPYGKPIQNARYYVFDDMMRHCRVQQPGNLYIGGDCLALGYYNDPVLSDSKFINDPYNEGSKLYLTGDKAQWMADGNIEFLGREDDQLKIRGYRVEIGEIKNMVLLNKAIKEAIVIPDKSNRHDIKVILFITTHNNSKLELKELRKELRACLPEYMIPAEIFQYPEFPVTKNGKVDSKKLLDDYLKGLESKSQKKTDNKPGDENIPLSSMEKKIHKIWCETLNIFSIERNDNFFDIGGNSLLSFRLINNIKEQLGCVMSFKEFLSHPTISESAIFIDDKCPKVSRTIKLSHLTRTLNLPLSRNQKRLWLISKIQTDIPSYLIAFSYKLTGSLDRVVFKKSVDILFQRHNIVFSRIRETDGEPYCDIVPTETDISFIDFTGLPEADKEKRTLEFIKEVSQKAFDLKQGPLYRLYLIMTRANEYYFHFSIHHIVFDGWSWSVFVNDLNEIYSRLLRDKSIDLKKLEFQQYDYAHWEKNSLDTFQEYELKKFWKENLTGSNPVLNFPYDFQRSEHPSGRGSYEAIILSRDLSQKFISLSKTEDASLFVTLLSAFGIQMYKYSGENDINIGLPIAYRPHSSLENIFGMFVNTVVVRLKYAGELTFKDIIHQTNDTALNAISHQELPFENVVEIVNPERYANTNPLFQISFAWQKDMDMPLKLDGIMSEKVALKEGTTPFDIILSLWENEDHIEGEIGYSTDLLNHDTIIRLKKNFICLAEKLIDQPGIPVTSISMITEDDYHMISDLNNTITKYPKSKTIVNLFEEQVIQNPDKPAIVFQDSSFTYKQLNERSNQLALTLRNMGVKTGVPVGILADKSLEMIVGILGTLKAGGVYLPIDPEYPVQRINFIIKESGCKILLTQSKYMELVVNGTYKVDMNSPDSYQVEAENLNSINNSSDVAYYMYTSGTTGVPKGSMIRHFSVVRLVRDINYMVLSSEDSILYTSSLVFDVSTFEIWGALLNGMTLYIVEKETILDPAAIGKELINNRISILHLTSALFTQLSEARTDIFAGLEYLLVGGDVLSAPHINKVRRDNPQLKVINCYGPSENTTYSTTYLIEKDFDHSIPIGKPVSNSTVYIFDKELNYQPVGVLGELYVGGDGLSKGYLNREDLNKSSFIDHPFIPGEKLYKTGDFGRWMPDGNIEFQGRVDNQLKIRGFRVELEEIESVISEIEGVIETVVKPVKVGEGDYRLIAFLNVPEIFKMDNKEIIARVKDKLPSYMIPATYRFMQGFPKTINGKTDKNALRIDIDDLVRKEKQDIKAITKTEAEVLKIWCESLKTHNISIQDNFFEIGGNSLIAISVMSKIEHTFNVELGLRVFFDSPRIKDLSETIDIARNKMVEGKTDLNNEKTNLKVIKGEI